MTHISSELPIGIFDSGLGGLSILNEIRNALPQEDIIYYADSNNAPYGEKQASAIIEISKHNTDFLLKKQCKLIVVACNTATTNSIGVLRKTYDVPFIGIEPAIKPAALSSKTGTIGILATKGTLSSKLFSNTVKKITTNTKVVEIIGKGIVEAIESNTENSKAFVQLLEKQIIPFKKAKIDTLVLGCSHYPFIMPKLRHFLGDKVNIIDSGFAVAKQTERILKKNKLDKKKTSNQNHIKIYTNGTSKKALKSVLNKINLEHYSIH